MKHQEVRKGNKFCWWQLWCLAKPAAGKNIKWWEDSTHSIPSRCMSNLIRSRPMNEKDNYGTNTRMSWALLQISLNFVVRTIQIIKNRNYFTSVCLGLGKNDVRMSNTIIETMMRILRQQESSWDVVVCCIVVLGFIVFVCWLVCDALLWMDFVQYLVVTRIGGEWVCMYDD